MLHDDSIHDSAAPIDSSRESGTLSHADGGEATDGSEDPFSCPSTPPTPAHWQVDLTLETESLTDEDAAWLERQTLAVLHLLKLTSVDLSLAIVEDEAMAALHVEHCDIEGTTDVLTFDLRDDPEQGDAIEGEIIICVDEAKRQAQVREHDVHAELLLYIVHGLLHLLGEDDHDDAAYQKMHARENTLLEQLGVGRLFGEDMSASPGAGDT